MKKILLFFSMALCASAANAQSDLAVMLDRNAGASMASTSASDESFLATLPGGENLVATRLQSGGLEYINIKKIHSDGSVTTIKNIEAAEPLMGLTCSASGGFTVMFGQVTGFYLMKFSATGLPIWQKSITVGEPITTYYAHTMVETAAGEYYLTISNFAWTGIVKIDASGNLAWAKKATGPRDTGKCPGFCSAATSTGGCITTLKDENYETIINMDGAGNLLWSRSFGDASYRWTRSIKCDNLGNFYILGTYGNVGATFFQKIDAGGNIVWAKNLSVSDSFEDAYVTASNEFYLLMEGPSMKLMKVGPTGTIAWAKGIGAVTTALTPFGTMHTTFFTSTPLRPELHFVASVNDSTPLVLKFSSPSEICNAFNYPVPNVSDDVQILDATIDTTANINPLVVTVANTGYGTNTTEYYTGTDFCSYIASVNELVAATELTVFPNPAASNFTIQLSNIQLSRNAVVAVYDMTGRKVHEAAVNSMSISVNTSGFAPGLYSVIVSDSDKVLGKQRVVIR